MNSSLPETFRLVQAERRAPPGAPAALPEPFLPDGTPAEGYVMDSGLEHAANTALALGMPLLLTGEPGTGKSGFAAHLAWQLGLGEPLTFHTKSSSVASDLFYAYDTVRRFHAAHAGLASADERDYLHFNALGRAMLDTLPAADTAHLFQRAPGSVHQPHRRVVLIDEIDKASRDFPNDLLHELPEMSFRIPELNASVRADARYRPIVVITSNRERPLPDAFLRRCIFYNIEAPDTERLQRILHIRFGEEDQLSRHAVAIYEKMRHVMARPPSTSELVAWYRILRSSGLAANADLQQVTPALLQSLPALAKTESDSAALRQLLSELH
ncbi:MoxR family ATPase [Massilia sp. BJB1822]|uniref:AAA family ATPase n=1 Tax=Massilia sp. BJB1822 TaxID=2744470 RepID=UPI001594284A|nr:MoxR family ATPase [Massilia sp. BJB1822]NVD99434.1 MoxR family ATPase [Massilia sp. BJB1822]